MSGVKDTKVDAKCQLVCSVCREFTTKCCSRCNNMAYCSKSCQVKDWPSHRSVCGIQQGKKVMGTKPTAIGASDSIAEEYRQKYPQHWATMEEKLMGSVSIPILRMNAQGVTSVTPKSAGKHMSPSSKRALDSLLAGKTDKQTILYIVLGKTWTLQRVSLSPS